MGLLLALQSRIPDRWLLRRLLPSALFVAVAFVGGGLGQSHWNDADLARTQLQRYLGGQGGITTAVVLYAIAVAVGAFVVPPVAEIIGTLAAGAWPWWLAPVGDRVLHRRVGRWRPPDELRDEALRARANGRTVRAARLDARAAAARPARPVTPTWTGDRLRLAADRVREYRGIDVETAWVALLLDLPESASAAVVRARDGYDSACEAMFWSIGYVVLGFWWWPAAAMGAILWLAAWRWLRHAGEALGGTAEAVARITAVLPEITPATAD